MSLTSVSGDLDVTTPAGVLFLCRLMRLVADNQVSHPGCDTSAERIHAVARVSCVLRQRQLAQLLDRPLVVVSVASIMPAWVI